MPFQPASAGRAAPNGGRFVLYLEGARDRDIVRAWSNRFLPGHSGRLFDGAVILGGRQPARAVAHFRELGGAADGVRALCVLDRDDGLAGDPPRAEHGLEFFTWSRRHIESYLLVPAAIRRALRLPDDDGLLERVLAEHVPPDADEDLLRDVDAKRLLGQGGVVSRALAQRIPLGRVARATRAEERHPDVHRLFDRMREGLGVPELSRIVR